MFFFNFSSCTFTVESSILVKSSSGFFKSLPFKSNGFLKLATSSQPTFKFSIDFIFLEVKGSRGSLKTAKCSGNL